LNKEVVEYYLSEDFKPIIPDKCNFRHFKVKTFNGTWRKIPEKINSRDDLVKWIIKFGGVDVYYSTSQWLNPHKISSKGGSGTYHIADNLLLNHDLVFDIDAEAPIDMKGLEGTRKCTHNIHYAMKKFSDQYEFDYVAFSLTGDSPILTNEGIINIKDARIGQEVLTFSDKIEYSKIYDTVKHEEKIWELTYENNTLPMKLTGSHAIYIWNNTELKCVDAKDIKEGDYVLTYNGFDIEEKVPKISTKFKYKQIEREIEVPITNKLMRLVGLYLAEGHLAKDDWKNDKKITFSFNSKEPYVDLCKELIKKTSIDVLYENYKFIKKLKEEGYSIKEISTTQNIKKNTIYRIINEKRTKQINVIKCYSPPSGVQISVSNPVLYHFLKDNFKFGFDKKRFPVWVFSLPKEYKLELLKGIIDGDGSKTNEYSTKIKLANKYLVIDICWLAKSIGLSATYSEDKSKDRPQPNGKGIIKASQGYCVNLNKSEIYGNKLKRFAPSPCDKLIPLDGFKYICKKHNITKYYNNPLRQIINCKQRSNRNNIIEIIGFMLNYKSCFDDDDWKIINNYSKWIKSKTGFLKVKSLKNTNKKEMVYDISVEKTQRFFTGNIPILLHNTGHKGFRLSYKNKSLELPKDPRQRIEYVENDRKLFIDRLLSIIKNSKDKRYYKVDTKFDEKVTINTMGVVRVLGTIHSSTNFISTKLPLALLRTPVEEILNQVPFVGKRRPVIPKREMTRDGAKQSPRSRLLTLADDVSGLASLPLSNHKYFITNKVLGIKKGFIPVLIYQRTKTNFKQELIKLQKKYKLGNFFINYSEDGIVAVSLKVMQNRQLQKLLNESTSRTKYDFKKHKRIFMPFSVGGFGVIEGKFTGNLSCGHHHYVRPNWLTNKKYFVGWDQVEFIRANKEKIND